MSLDPRRMALSGLRKFVADRSQEQLAHALGLLAAAALGLAPFRVQGHERTHLFAQHVRIVAAPET